MRHEEMMKSGATVEWEAPRSKEGSARAVIMMQ
jgi:hypothetical protein